MKRINRKMVLIKKNIDTFFIFISNQFKLFFYPIEFKLFKKINFYCHVIK